MQMTDMLWGKDEKPEDEQEKDVDFTTYEEGIYVGYRHFDTQKLDVSYPFGFGLSYTDFAVSEVTATLEDDVINVTAVVQNIGANAGKEVVQVYVAKPETAIDRAAQELKAFAKTSLLAPEASETLTFQIPVNELSYWNENTNNWSLESGTYRIKVGTSSRNIAQEVEITLE